MRVRSLLASSLVLAVALAPAAPRAQAPPDLSGTWVLADAPRDAHASDAAPPAFGRGFTARQDARELVIEPAHGGGRITYALGGGETETHTAGSVTASQARWQDGALVITAKTTARGDDGKTAVTEHTRRLRLDGKKLVVETEVTAPQPGLPTTSVYERRAADAPAQAAPARLAALSWLAGNWVGQAGRATLEERWTRAAGGAMLAVSRTVVGDRMVAFEFLRIVERDGSLVYIAQPNGVPPTEFVLTHIDESRAVFENPAHDYPKVITYTLGPDDTLEARISDSGGHRAQSFSFRRE